MITIELYEYSPTGDGLFYSVRKNNEPQYTDFENEKDAKAAAFDQACMATLEGSVRVIYTSNKERRASSKKTFILCDPNNDTGNDDGILDKNQMTQEEANILNDTLRVNKSDRRWIPLKK